jgi:hypothetical protein
MKSEIIKIFVSFPLPLLAMSGA